MSKNYTLVKPGDIVFKESMSYEECVKTLANKIRTRQKENLEELKSIPMWKLMFDEVVYKLPAIIGSGVIAGLFGLLFLNLFQTVIFALGFMLCVTVCISIIESVNTKREIKVREKEYKETNSLSDKELIEYNFEYNPFETETEHVLCFYNLKDKNIVAMRATDVKSYEFKYAEENGDVIEFDEYLVYNKLIENINIDCKLLIELNEDFEIIIRTKEYCNE